MRTAAVGLAMMGLAVALLLPASATADEPPLLPMAPPVPYVIVLDIATWRGASQLTEGREYAFNASGTWDDSLVRPEDNVNLTYEWQFGDGTILGPGKGGAPDFLLNATHTYAEWGSYAFRLKAVDSTGERAWLERTIVVAAAPALHPDLMVVPGTFRLSPDVPEEGEDLHLWVNITNYMYRAEARRIRVTFGLIESGFQRNQSGVRTTLRDAEGREIDRLAANETATIEVVWKARAPGSHNARIVVWDRNEPWPWVTMANGQSFTFVVSPPYSRWSVTGPTAIGVIALLAVVVVLAGLGRLGRRGRRDGERS